MTQQFSNEDRLRYFSEEEFRGWYGDMNMDTLNAIDNFRHLLGIPVFISPATGTIGRHMGPESTSQHNIDKWGQVNALDIMFAGLGEKISYQRAVDLAIDAGFNGIGVYPDWNPMAGMHVDCRIPKEDGHIALWSCFLKEQIDGTKKYNYYPIFKAFESTIKIYKKGL